MADEIHFYRNLSEIEYIILSECSLNPKLVYIVDAEYIDFRK
jgi:hypothetical protein